MTEVVTEETEFNPFLAVEKGLPPGLWLPTAEESTDKYLAINFNHGDHDPEDLIDLGAFAVALLVLDAPSHPRKSLMPGWAEFEALHSAGYGLSHYHLQVTYENAVLKIQEGLGFYANNTKDPTEEELKKRLKWMGRYALDIQEEFPDRQPKVRQILEWGRDRNLLPPLHRTRQILGKKHTQVVREIFPIEIPRFREQVTYKDAYRLGSQILFDKGRPATVSELNDEYNDTCVGKPSNMLHNLFGPLGKFWWEGFDIISDSKWMKWQDLVNAGVRLAIKTRDPVITVNRMETLSAQRKFPHPKKIRQSTEAHSVIPFQQEIEVAYEEYLGLRRELKELGVSREVCELACQRYDTRLEFSNWLRDHMDVLATLSNDSKQATYVRQLIARGFNLLEDDIYAMQVTDFKSAIRNLKLKQKDELRFVLNLIPRLDTDEFLAAA